MEVFSASGIHFGFLQPWSQVLSWHMYNQPWFQGKDLLAMFTFYAQLRYRLLPYIYSAAHVAAHRACRSRCAMPLVAPDDPECAGADPAVHVGDASSPCAFTDRIYLPPDAGSTYWTGTVHEGPVRIPCAHPRTAAGALRPRRAPSSPCGRP